MKAIEVPCPVCEAPAGENCRRLEKSDQALKCAESDVPHFLRTIAAMRRYGSVPGSRAEKDRLP